MADISIQFHALPEEVTAFAQQCMQDFNLYAVAMKYFPFEAAEVTAEEMGKLSEAKALYEELGLTLQQPRLPAKDNVDFYLNNPARLRITLARKEPAGLRQIGLSARTDDVDALAIWKKIARRLKGITRAGVVVMNPDTGASGPERTFRYTAGAKALASSGVPMLPIAGGNLVIFPEG
jgi:hypothetical protein